MMPQHLPLHGRRALVPPSRPDVHPLQRMLERDGAEVLVIPRLLVDEYEPADRSGAIERWPTFDWIVVSGAPSARRWLHHVNERAWAERPDSAPKLVTIGAGATSTLRNAGVHPNVVPKRHTAPEVSASMGALAGQRVLLIRAQDASDELPNRLRSAGAEATEEIGYRVRLEAERAQLEAAAPRLDIVAFANPTAVRLFDRALRESAMTWRPGPDAVCVAVAGPATAQAARSVGIEPTLVAEGSLRSLVERLRERYASDRRG